MLKQPNPKTRLSVTVEDGQFHLRLRIPVQTLLAVLALLTGSPALVAALTRLAGG